MSDQQVPERLPVTRAVQPDDGPGAPGARDQAIGDGPDDHAEPGRPVDSERFPVSRAAVRLALVCLVLTALSTVTIAGVEILGYLFPRDSASQAPVIPSANSYDPNSATATATTGGTAQPTAAPSASQSGGSYRAVMTVRAAAFRAAYARVESDSLAAQKSQWDLRWPGILERDANAVASAAGSISAVKPPPDLGAQDATVDRACQAVIAGADAFRSGIASLSSSRSEAGYRQLAAARDQLEQALKLLGV